MSLQLSPEYTAALEASRIASRKFAQAQADYRARKINDEQFLAARAEHIKAEREFDKAFEKEEDRQS